MENTEYSLEDIETVLNSIPERDEKKKLKEKQSKNQDPKKTKGYLLLGGKPKKKKESNKELKREEPIFDIKVDLPRQSMVLDQEEALYLTKVAVYFGIEINMKQVLHKKVNLSKKHR